jgi:hypothetical protein
VIIVKPSIFVKQSTPAIQNASLTYCQREYKPTKIKRKERKGKKEEKEEKGTFG